MKITDSDINNAMLDRLHKEKAIEIICAYCKDKHHVIESLGTRIECKCGAIGNYQRLGKTIDWFWSMAPAQ